MKALVIGGGGREHALAWKLAQSNSIERVFVAPGNAGTALEHKLQNMDIGVTDIDKLVEFVQSESVDFTVVGPEAPLVAGVVDTFQKNGLRIFGPTQAAAQLEGSKAFSKEFLVRHNIPTAAYEAFTDLDSAIAYIRDNKTPIVVKADGLAAGKGVVLAQTEAEAITAVTDMLSGNAFGDAGHRVVIEEYLEGEEVSFIVMANGTQVLPMASSQDHKARDDGDVGPNTGGMGAYSPAPAVTSRLYARIMREVIQPTLVGMSADGMPYTGFLYAGLMITADGTPKVLEFNCRFGDPETQPIMLRLQSDFAQLCNAAIDGELDDCEIEWDARAALGVVMAAGGYPGDYQKGLAITGADADFGQSVKVFHAGTALQNSTLLTNGGRVLCVTALGDTVAAAQEDAYEAVRTIDWDSVYFRSDIGYRAVKREL